LKKWSDSQGHSMTPPKKKIPPPKKKKKKKKKTQGRLENFSVYVFKKGMDRIKR